MKRCGILALFLLLLMGSFANALAETEVKMTGDMRMYGSWHLNHNYTGWNAATWSANSPTSYIRSGTKTEDTFVVWERFRLRTDFIANENLKFRLGLRVENTWGRGTYTAANPAAAVEVYMAFLQFKWPGTNVEVTAGLHQVSMPHSSLFFDSPVFGGERIAGLTVQAPLVDGKLMLQASFLRLFDTNQSYDDDTTQVGDEFDAYVLTLPITVGDAKITPWAMAAVSGKTTNYWTTYMGPNQVGAYLAAPGTLVSPAGWKTNQNPYFWAGSAFEIKTLDPFNFYADVIVSSAAMTDAKKNQRKGWMVDFGAEYTGWDLLTPQVFGWYASGEDGSIANGSERLALIKPNWGAGSSWLYDTDLEFPKDGTQGGSMVPSGTWGAGASLQNITFVEKLSHRLTLTYVHGTNSPRAIRTLNFLVGSNPYFTMGRDLTVNESVLAANFDHKYKLYENLAFIVETGWAHGDFQQSVWGHRLTSKAASNDNNEWKVAFGFTYKY
ncbi:MAG: outer membrane homotrimeric porin [Solidesulfovibrio sp.]